MIDMAQGPRIPVPGVHEGDSFDPGDELMYSSVGTTQKGVTIAGGQGVLESGTLLGQKASDKKYYAEGYDSLSGVLRRTVDTDAAGGADQLGNIVVMGIMYNHMIKGDKTAAENDLGAVIDVTRDTFKL